jgi:hypothetical protein
MKELLARIKHGLTNNLYPTEKAVSTSIVVPVLRALGWDDTDPTEVVGEYTNPRGRVDYALFTRTGAANVFVEVKAVGRSQDADRQLFEYAFHEGTPLAVLTDGRLWNFYLPGQHGSYEERRVYQIDMVERTTEEIAERLQRYLARDRVANGNALDDATADYRTGARSRVALSTLPRAWVELLADPPEELIEALSAHTEALCGHRPGAAVVMAFLTQRISVEESPQPIKRSPRNTQDPLVSIQRPVQPPAESGLCNVADPERVGVMWRVLSQHGTAKNGVDAFQATLTALFNQFPEKRNDMAMSVRTRGRNNIASRIEDIYPSQIELARKQNRSLPGGWFVGTNENSATKLRIIRQATTAAGLVFGRDVEIDL